MFQRIRWWVRAWFKQKQEIAKLTEHVHVLNTRFKYLQERLDKMEVPR